jgi:hypothetical protein
MSVEEGVLSASEKIKLNEPNAAHRRPSRLKGEGASNARGPRSTRSAHELDHSASRRAAQIQTFGQDLHLRRHVSHQSRIA